MVLRETNDIFGGGGAQSGEEAALRKDRAKDALKGFGSPCYIVIITIIIIIIIIII